MANGTTRIMFFMFDFLKKHNWSDYGLTSRISNWKCITCFEVSQHTNLLTFFLSFFLKSRSSHPQYGSTTCWKRCSHGEKRTSPDIHPQCSCGFATRLQSVWWRFLLMCMVLSSWNNSVGDKRFQCKWILYSSKLPYGTFLLVGASTKAHVK